MKDMLCEISHSLTDIVHENLANLDKVDTQELCEAIKMIKNLQEAIYYYTMTEKIEAENETK